MYIQPDVHVHTGGTMEKRHHKIEREGRGRAYARARVPSSQRAHAHRKWLTFFSIDVCVLFVWAKYIFRQNGGTKMEQKIRTMAAIT